MTLGQNYLKAVIQSEKRKTNN